MRRSILRHVSDEPAAPRPADAEALAAFAGTFCRFRASDRTVLRRLGGMALLDHDLERLLRNRDEMRRTALIELLALRALVN
ncbi:hypothetical protein AB0C74_18695 [Spirillospora sp. NPDC048832]